MTRRLVPVGALRLFFETCTGLLLNPRENSYNDSIYPFGVFMSAHLPRPRHDPPQINRRFLQPLRQLIRLNYFSLKVRGANNIPNEGPILFVANHSG